MRQLVPNAGADARFTTRGQRSAGITQLLLYTLASADTHVAETIWQ